MIEIKQLKNLNNFKKEPSRFCKEKWECQAYGTYVLDDSTVM